MLYGKIQFQETMMHFFEIIVNIHAYLLVVTKITFIQTTKDSFGNLALNGEAQNIVSHPINNVMVI